ncbi:putative nucleic acid-binding protein, containsPIN domain [groundwater metagenome]
MDTSVIIKSIFKPARSLPEEKYEREMTTHKKCTYIIKTIEEKDIDTYIPYVCIVETAAVAKRLSDKALARRISKSIFDSYEIVGENIIFESAWDIAKNTGCSGFDSYFIALAHIKNALLITDDGGMHNYAEESDVDSVLVREIELGKIKKLF